MPLEHIYVDADKTQDRNTGHSTVRFIASSILPKIDGLSLIEGTLPAGESVYLHSHADPEFFYVVSGGMEIYEEQNSTPHWRAVRPGDTAIIHPHAKHAWKNNTSEDCLCLIITGADVMRFLDCISSAQERALGEDPDPKGMLERILKIAEETHCWLGTPEENEAIGLHFHL